MKKDSELAEEAWTNWVKDKGAAHIFAGLDLSDVFRAGFRAAFDIYAVDVGFSEPVLGGLKVTGTTITRRNWS